MKKLSLLVLAVALFGCAHKNEKPKKHTLSKSDMAYLKAVHENDLPMDEPGFADWRAQHDEKIQSFGDYVTGEPYVPNQEQRVIYLQPIGDFDALETQAIALTRQYIEIFFERKTVVLGALSDAQFPADAKRQNFGHEQIRTGHILYEILEPDVPDDAIAVMAISKKDLYPSDDWNYVFGQASYKKRIGVASIYRLEDEHLQHSNFERCLKRLLNVSSHEIGHMLSLHHCLFAKCAMNGSNNLEETDRSPNRLCSDCQKKLTWNLGYDNRKRLQKLYAFLETNLPEDAAYLKKDLAVLEQ